MLKMRTNVTISPSVSLSSTQVSLLDLNQSTPSVRQDSSDILLISLQINKYYLWVIFALGFPGNVFAITTILKLKPRHRSALYVAFLALVDNTCLTCKLLFITLTRFDVAIGDPGCGVLEFLGIFTGQWANWLLVAMTTDRCLEITMPLKSRKFGKRHYATCLISMTSVLVFLNLPYFFITEYKESSPGDFNCVIKQNYLTLAEVLGWINVAIYALVPSVLLTVMSALIFRALKKSMDITVHLTFQEHQLRKREKVKRDITIMIVVACVVFTILVTPRPLLSAILKQWDPQHDTSTEERMILLGQVFYLLSDSSHAVNFYLYFLTNGRFRKQFYKTIRRLICVISCCFYACRAEKWSPGQEGQQEAGQRSETTSHVWMTPETFSTDDNA